MNFIKNLKMNIDAWQPLANKLERLELKKILEGVKEATKESMMRVSELMVTIQ